MPRVSPSSPDASRRMARVRQKGTQAEIDLRRALHAKGLRYRLQVPLLTKPRRVVDIVFPRARVAVPHMRRGPKATLTFGAIKLKRTVCGTQIPAGA
jgi:hypothetical protein